MRMKSLNPISSLAKKLPLAGGRRRNAEEKEQKTEERKDSNSNKSLKLNSITPMRQDNDERNKSTGHYLLDHPQGRMEKKQSTLGGQEEGAENLFELIKERNPWLQVELDKKASAMAPNAA